MRKSRMADDRDRLYRPACPALAENATVLLQYILLSYDGEGAIHALSIYGEPWYTGSDMRNLHQ